MTQILADSIEGRVLRHLEKNYPITITELEKALKSRDLSSVMRNLERSGLVELETLPDKTYIRLTGKSRKYLGIKANQIKKMKKMQEKAKSEDFDNKGYR